MNSEANSPSPVLRRPAYLANTTSARLFNHNYSPKSSSKTGSELSYPCSSNQQVYYQPAFRPTYPTAYQNSFLPAYQPSIPSLNNSYSLPQRQSQPQIQSPNGLPLSSTTPYQVNLPTAFNSPVLSVSGISISSNGLETILIAILILVALDLIVIRPNRVP